MRSNSQVEISAKHRDVVDRLLVFLVSNGATVCGEFLFLSKYCSLVKTKSASVILEERVKRNFLVRCAERALNRLGMKLLLLGEY